MWRDGVHTAPDHEPITLREHQIPSHEIFETFLLHASFVHENEGTEAYHDFLHTFGLDPDSPAVEGLHSAFDELEESRVGHSQLRKAEQLGELFASLIAAVESDGSGTDGRSLWFEIIRQIRPKVSWVFVDEHPKFEVIEEAEEHFREALSGSISGVIGTDA